MNDGIFFDKVYNKLLNLAFKKGKPNDFYKILSFLNDKGCEYDFNIKDESDFFYNKPEQYDFDYRQQWAINNGFNI